MCVYDKARVREWDAGRGGLPYLTSRPHGRAQRVQTVKSKAAGAHHRRAPSLIPVPPPHLPHPSYT